MEYMDGGSLADRLEEYPSGLPLDEALWIGECICHGVKLAHDYGIAHLDLKPSNILFRQTGRGTWDIPKIADWGLARVLIEDSKGIDGFSPAFAAPEQFNPEQFGEPDSYTDVYQVGVILYSLLTGNPPYTGGLAEVRHRIINDRSLTPPSNICPEITSEVDGAVLQALSRSKSSRYPDISRLGETLNTLRTDDHISKGKEYIPQEDSTWPLFQGDPTRSGLCNVSGPIGNVSSCSVLPNRSESWC